MPDIETMTDEANGQHAPLDERQPFCTVCGFVGSIDEDGTCAACGCDTCGLDQLREHLAARGLHVVSAADKATLEALDAVPEADLRNAIESPRTSHEIAAFARGALARVEAPGD